MTGAVVSCVLSTVVLSCDILSLLVSSCEGISLTISVVPAISTGFSFFVPTRIRIPQNNINITAFTTLLSFLLLATSIVSGIGKKHIQPSTHSHNLLFFLGAEAFLSILPPVTLLSFLFTQPQYGQTKASSSINFLQFLQVFISISFVSKIQPFLPALNRLFF